MKRLLITSIFLLTGHVYAQEWTFAPEVGLNISNISGNGEKGDYKLGLKAGFVVNMPLSDHLFLQPGLFYSQKGYKQKGDFLSEGLNTNYNYIELPLNLLYRFDLGQGGKLFASAGMYAAYAITGRITSENGNLSSRIEYGGALNQTAPFDLGANVGVGYETPWNFYIRGQYGLGLISMSNWDHNDTRNRVFQVTLGYLIGRN